MGYLVFGMESSVGTLPPKESLRFYMATVDPHLTHGCEISPDIDSSLLESLEVVQHDFLRRTLGLYKKSMTLPLFTETGIIPLKFRRLMLCLGYLKYLITLPSERLARKALEDSITLDHQNKPCWLMDIRYVIERLNLPEPIIMPDLLTAGGAEIDDLIKKIEQGMNTMLQSQLENSTKLYLLHGRPHNDPISKKGKRVLMLRHYLMIANHDHRQSLTRIVTSCHAFALERLRWTQGRQPRIDPELRQCRMCLQKIESPEHAVLECNDHPELIIARKSFFDKISPEVPRLRIILLLNAREEFVALLSIKSITGLLAKLCHETAEIFASKPMYIPPLPLHWLIREEEEVG